MRVRQLAAIAVIGSVVGAPAVFAQEPAPEFADWTSYADGFTVVDGTLLGRPVRMAGGAFHPAGPLDGSSTVFSGPEFSPPLAQSDAPEFQGTNPASTRATAA